MIGIKDQCFGCEIEMTGLSRSRAAQAIAELFGTGCQHYGGYDAYHMLCGRERSVKQRWCV